MVEKNEGICDVCGKTARQFCASCKATFYCSKECQKKSWKSHKLQCRPFAIKSHETYGRCAVATRDIKAGELFLKECPLIIGPKQATIPLCLGCHGDIKNSTLFCDTCHFPLCSTSCQNSKYHKDECTLLSKAKSRIRFPDNLKDQINPAYDCITPLRCLLLKNFEPKKWEELLELESNEEQMKNTSFYNVNKRNIVDFIRIFLNYDEFEPEMIHRVCGILQTNAFELKEKGSKIRGLYPISAMFAHSCTPNTKHAFDINNTILFRATKHISKGEVIFTTYTQTIWDTLSRRTHLKLTKFFLCSCERCEDETELGTHLSSLLCSQCGGEMTSIEPLNNETDWKCRKCDYVVHNKQITFGNDVLKKELQERGKKDKNLLEDFLNHYKKTLHPNHRFMTEVKYNLIKLYGNFSDYRYKDLSQKQLENKVEWCRNLLDIANKIEPEKSFLRGTVLFELQAGLVGLAKHLLSNDIITKEQGEEYMSEAVGYLQEASEILKHEPYFENGGLDDKLKWLSDELEL